MVTTPGLNDTRQAAVLQEEMNLGSDLHLLPASHALGVSWPRVGSEHEHRFSIWAASLGLKYL